MNTLNLVYPIPAEAVEVLKMVLAEVPEALVAGWCLRDAIMCRPVNDIDIFVPDDKARIARYAISDTHPDLLKSIPEPYFTFNSDVRCVDYYGSRDGRLPVNIIGVTKGTCTPEMQLKRFDFGICRVAFAGRRLWKDMSFDRDQRDETFTLTDDFQSEEQRGYSLQRYERLSVKYPGWKLVMPLPRVPFDGDIFA